MFCINLSFVIIQIYFYSDFNSEYSELNETNDDENHREEQYKLRKQLNDRNNEITLLRSQIDELESSNRRKQMEDKKEEVDKDDEEEKNAGEDIQEYLLSSKKK